MVDQALSERDLLEIQLQTLDWHINHTLNKKLYDHTLTWFKEHNISVNFNPRKRMHEVHHIKYQKRALCR